MGNSVNEKCLVDFDLQGIDLLKAVRTGLTIYIFSPMILQLYGYGKEIFIVEVKREVRNYQLEKIKYLAGGTQNRKNQN